jgi:nucleoid DNA-binding protein
LSKYFGLTTAKKGFDLQDLREIVRKVTGRSRDESANIASAIVRIMTRELAKTKRLSFHDFCTLSVIPATKRKFVMFKGEPRFVKKKWRIKQYYSKNFKKFINE